VGEEAAELVSFIPIVGGSDVGIIGHDKVILSQLVLHLRDNGSVAGFGDFGECCSLQELAIFLVLEHSLELGSHGDTHFVNLSLKED
jgi:hypothetical protein